MTTPNVITTVLVPAVAQFAGGGPYDLCALADVQAEFTTQSGDVTWLQSAITRMSYAAKHYCNQVLQVQRYQTRIWPFRDSVPRKFSADLLPLQLPHWPLATGQSQAGVAPPQAPSLSSVSGGSLAAARYYGRITLVTAQGETAPSLETNLAIAANDLPSVASPPQDRAGLATGWNCYLGTAANAETLQNASPIPIGTAFVLPGTGLTAGAALPAFALVSEAGQTSWPLTEGTDFILDLDLGRVERLHHVTNTARSFSSWPLIVEYSAGLATIDPDIQDAIIQWVKLKYFARNKDPAVRESNVEGVYSESRWFGTGPGGAPDMPNYVQAALDRFRVPVLS